MSTKNGNNYCVACGKWLPDQNKYFCSRRCQWIHYRQVNDRSADPEYRDDVTDAMEFMEDEMDGMS